MRISLWEGKRHIGSSDDWMRLQADPVRRQRLRRDVIEWDVRNWAGCLEFWSPVLQGLIPGESRILAVGERNGGISLWLAYLGFCVTCSDFTGPTEKAKQLHAQYGVQSRITYAPVDVFSIPFPDNFFDVVACKSVIGGLKLARKDPSTRTLASQRMAVSEIRRVLRPGGFFLGAENLRGSWAHQKLRAVVKGGRIGWRHMTCSEIDLLFEGFQCVEQKCHGFLGSRVKRCHIDWLTGLLDAVLCRFLPESWLYISFIRARK